jgi:hypothetical protein
MSLLKVGIFLARVSTFFELAEGYHVPKGYGLRAHKLFMSVNFIVLWSCQLVRGTKTIASAPGHPFILIMGGPGAQHHVGNRKR